MIDVLVVDEPAARSNRIARQLHVLTNLAFLTLCLVGIAVGIQVLLKKGDAIVTTRPAIVAQPATSPPEFMLPPGFAVGAHQAAQAVPQPGILRRMVEGVRVEFVVTDHGRRWSLRRPEVLDNGVRRHVESLATTRSGRATSFNRELANG